MDEKLDTYFNEIGLTGILISNVKEIINNVQNIFNETIKEIFISQTIDGNDFRNLFIFIENKMILVQNFKTIPEYHFFTIDKTITYIKVVPQNFNFKNVLDISNLSINLNIAGSEFYLDPLFATKNNCKYLYMILQTYFIANLFE